MRFLGSNNENVKCNEDVGMTKVTRISLKLNIYQ